MRRAMARTDKYALIAGPRILSRTPILDVSTGSP